MNFLKKKYAKKIIEDCYNNVRGFSMKIFIPLFVALSLVFCGGKQKEIITQETKIGEVKVTFFSGEASILRDGNTLKPQQGMALLPEDEIQTGKTGRMEILVKNSGLLKVAPMTILSVAAFSSSEGFEETQIQLKYGSLVSVVRKEKKNESFQVVTPTLVAGVRGTIFSTRVQDKEGNETSCANSSCVVSVEVLEGKVAVRKKSSTEEIVLEKNSKITTTGEEELAQKMILPLGRDSLEKMKDMLIFHKDSVGGFENLLDELKASTKQLAEMESMQTLEDAKKSIQSKAASKISDEVRKQVDEMDTRKYLEKDLSKEKLKLEPKNTF